MTKTEKTTELVKANNNPLLVGMDFSTLEADAGAGAQNISAKDLQTPMIGVLQANSPQCLKSNPKYIHGAEQGMFYNNVTGEVYSGDEGLVVVPCFFEKLEIEWKPNRDGFVAAHPANTHLKNQVRLVPSSENPDKTTRTLPNGNVLVETNQHYILILKPDGSFEPAVMAMSSSFLAASRKWNYLIKSVSVQGTKGPFNPASYYTHYVIRTVGKQKDSKSWYIPVIESLGPVPNSDIYNAGKALEQAVSSGSVQVKQEETHAVNESIDNNIPMDDDIPF